MIPYAIDTSYIPHKAVFDEAVDRWQSKTNHVVFRPAIATDQHYLYVTLQTGDAGQSWVGMQPTRGQYVWLLDPSIFPASHVAHELGHAIGLFHEQTRPDRDSYVQVEYNNIQQGWVSQFAPPTQPASTLGTPFDFSSIMLYNYQAGSLNPNNPNMPAVVSLWPQISGNQYQWGLGSSDIQGPSVTDIQAVESCIPARSRLRSRLRQRRLRPCCRRPQARSCRRRTLRQAFSPRRPRLPRHRPGFCTRWDSVRFSTGSSITITITVPYSGGSPAVSTSGPMTGPAPGPAIVPSPAGPAGVLPPVGRGSARGAAGRWCPSGPRHSQSKKRTFEGERPVTIPIGCRQNLRGTGSPLQNAWPTRGGSSLNELSAARSRPNFTCNLSSYTTCTVAPSSCSPGEMGVGEAGAAIIWGPVGIDTGPPYEPASSRIVTGGPTTIPASVARSLALLAASLIASLRACCRSAPGLSTLREIPKS